jgi:hypothetical protein
MSVLVFILGAAIALPATVFAQTPVGGPARPANFGIDADVYARTIERGDNTGEADTDDWYPDAITAGTGEGVIDIDNISYYGNTVGWAVVRADLLAASLIGRNKAFTAGMKSGLPDFNLDAIYARDHMSADGAVDTTVYSGGSNKNADNPVKWNLGPGSTPQKNDIIDAAGHLRRDTSDNNLWLTAHMTTISADGNSHVDFEFFATNVLYDGSLQELTGLGPDGGHTQWTTTAPGDLIFSVDFENGGTNPFASVRIWVDPDPVNLAALDAAYGFKFTGLSDGGDSSGIFEYAEIEPDIDTLLFYSRTAIVGNRSQLDGAGPPGQRRAESVHRRPIGEHLL